MTEITEIPRPTGSETWRSYAHRLSNVLSVLIRPIDAEQTARPVQLSHRKRGLAERASEEGILLYDQLSYCPVVTVETQTAASPPARDFSVILNGPATELDYTLATGVNGSSIPSATATKVPFTSNSGEYGPIRPEAGGNSWLMQQGLYEVHGFINLENTAAFARNVVCYFGDRDSGVAVSGTSLVSGEVSSSGHLQINVLGRLNIASETAVSMYVIADGADVRFGYDHGIVGYNHTLARIHMRIVGTNES